MTFRLHTGSALLACLLLGATTAGCAESIDDNEEQTDPAQTLEQVRGTGDEVFPSHNEVKVTAVGSRGCGKFAAPGRGVSSTSQTIILGEVKNDHAISGFRDIDCLLTIDYQYPAGWTFDLPEVQLRGFANNDQLNSSEVLLDVGMGLGDVTEMQVFRPDTREDFLMTISQATAARRGGSTRCGATSATVRVRVTAHSQGLGGKSLTTLDSLDTRLRWRRCR